jgi:hypothetical protein
MIQLKYVISGGTTIPRVKNVQELKDLIDFLKGSEE